MNLSNSECLITVNNGPNGNVLGEVTTFSCLPVLLNELITAALYFAGFVAVVFIIWAGIRFILSGGDAAKVKSARQTLTFAIIGLLLVFFSFAIVTIVGLLTGVHCISQFKDWGFDVCTK